LEKQDFARTVASSVSNASWVCVYETIRSSKEIWVFKPNPLLPINPHLLFHLTAKPLHQSIGPFLVRRRSAVGRSVGRATVKEMPFTSRLLGTARD